MNSPKLAQTESESSISTTRVRRNPFWKWVKRFVFLLFIITLSMGGFVWYAYRSAQIVPEYYELLLQQPEEELSVAGDQFETEVLELQNSAIETGQWQAIFTQDQINGWLASDLPEKFPNRLPRSVSQPRVSIANDELKIAFRFESKRVKGIVEASGDLFCTEDLNQVAIRIKHIRSGVLSLPLSAWTDRIGSLLRKNGFPIRWTEEAGDTIALIDLPQKIDRNPDQKLIVESIEVLDEKIVISGVTLDPKDLEAYRQALHDKTAEKTTEQR